MSSILTNTGSMIALQTLSSVNKNLSMTQNEISTGKKVATAKENSALWAISKVMESDVRGFKAISESLSLGDSTVAVARQAAESVTDLLTKMKEKIVAAQEDNIDRVKVQADVDALRNQIASVTSAAQFNGLNLLTNVKTTTAYTAAGNVDDTGKVNVLASLDRSATGVLSADITVEKQDLGTAKSAAGALTLAATSFTAAGTATANGAANATYTISGEIATAGRTKTVMAGDTYAFNMTIFDAAVSGTPFASAVAAKQTAIYTAKDGETTADIAKGLTAMINFRLAEQGLSTDFSVTAANNVVTVKNNTATALAASAAGNITTTAGGTVGGGLALLSELDVSTSADAEAALSAIEGLIQTAVDSSASFGSVQGRIETQQTFVTGLTDALKTGIGTLVDANMEEASAKLQALQVQQQLAVQSLSIANQAPQTILSLFQ